MLKVNITYQESNIKEIEFIGHAMYDDYGKDIVCAAASSILITTVNGILSFDESYLDVKKETDKVIISVLKENDITTKLLGNMMKLLKDLETQYPQNLKIN